MINNGIELIIGVVAPLGTNRKNFLTTLTNLFVQRDYVVHHISITKEAFNLDNSKFPESFKYYFKMQLCNNIRKHYTRGFFGFLAAYIISQKRKIESSEQKIVYIVDQIKNSTESDILNHIYGLNYFQISLFSNDYERDKELKNKFANDSLFKIEKYNLNIDPEKKYDKIFTNNFKKRICKLTSDIAECYSNEVLSDVSHNLMKKDFDEIGINNEFGQQVSKLFHQSHYFFNLDFPQSKIDSEIKKFVKIISGEYQEYPTQDEFGMNLAYQVSVRSNFPGDRHIGAAIITNQGEVISVASIRAPSQSSNTTLNDQSQIKDGYELYKKKIEDWEKYLDTLPKRKYNHTIKDIKNFLKSSLDFHPCTHAEIAAIIDAAKIGVSVRNSILYTTTFPCHLCAKEIINSGICRVVYLEAYPKSKNKELYPNIIDFDPKNKSPLLPFDFYYGIGPRRFMYAYALKNKVQNEFKLPPLIRYQKSKYYLSREEDVINYIANRIKKTPDDSLMFLKDLFKDDL